MSRTVVVVGGGYGGTAVAKALESQADVVLIDPRDAFVNVAGALRALTRPDWAGNIFFPFDTVLSRGRLIRDRAVSVDPGGVTLASGQRVAADYLVLATGSSYAYPARLDANSVEEALDDLRQSNKELAGAQRVLILGAGPVGLELAGEIKDVWPDKQVTIVDPAERLLPGFRPEMRDDLHRQLDELGIEVRLGTGLAAPLTTGANRAATFTATTTDGDQITADIWFRAHGLRINSDYLDDSRLTTLTAQRQVSVTETLNVHGPDGILGHVYAIGDLTDVAEDKMAAYALRHAEVVVRNISAQLRDEQGTATYQPMPDPMILVPLGSRHGVGQMPTPDGPAVVPAATVAEYKGVDLFTGRFTEQFGPTATGR
ncbi:NAD(P)/FAD-dependent oxidoreductase [Micromonospora sp. NPDC047557]|uniref:NAD(P)/FAD-dependent oxidoreductase n=1 Tax=Micromonospora sp. NPDC047557 TaxID=3364250 RepID=UPI00372393D3